MRVTSSCSGIPLSSLVALFMILVVVAVSAPSWAGGSQAYTNGSEDFGVGKFPPTGLYYIHYTNYYNTNNFKDDNGDKIDGAPEVTTFANTSRLLWISSKKILGGTYASHIFVPIVYSDYDFDDNSNFPRNVRPDSQDKFGLGNIIFSPFIVGWHGQDLHAFINLVDIFMPTNTGYDNDDTVNLGNDFWTFEPVFAVSYFPGQYELSAKFMYDISTNDNNHLVTVDEARQLGRPEIAGDNKTRRAGQEFHFDWVAAYHPNAAWELGAVGYFYQQITDDEISGSDVNNRKGRVAAVGPGVKYNMKDLSLIGKAYYEGYAENRNESISAYFKLLYKF